MEIATTDTVRQLTPRRSRRYWLSRGFKYRVLLLYALISLAPFYFVVSTAFKTEREISRNPLAPPTTLHWENVSKVWEQGRFGRYFLISVIVSVPIVLGTVCLASLAGCALARLKLPGANFVFYFILIGLMVPFTSIMIPLFHFLKDIHLLGTYWAMILPQIALWLPFSIFFMRAFFTGLPYELADAAKIDGCNEFGVFWRVMLPLSGPAISAMVVFNFMAAWNAFLLPLVYMQRGSLRPIMVGMMFFRDAYSRAYSLEMAGAIIVMPPIIVVYVIFQRKFVQRLTAGAIKE